MRNRETAYTFFDRTDGRPFLHPGLERETNRVFIFPVDITCHHCYYTVYKKRTLASITDVPCC